MAFFFSMMKNVGDTSVEGGAGVTWGDSSFQNFLSLLEVWVSPDMDGTPFLDSLSWRRVEPSWILPESSTLLLTIGQVLIQAGVVRTCGLLALSALKEPEILGSVKAGRANDCTDYWYYWPKTAWSWPGRKARFCGHSEVT